MGKCIYKPTGAAKEYAHWACNLYIGCPHACNYCYCKRGVLGSVMGKDIPVLKKTVGRNANEALQTFEYELVQYKDRIKEEGYLFFSFSTDPLCNEEERLTYECVRSCVNMGVNVQLLTKAVDWLNRYEWERLLSKSKGLIRVGTTLTGCDKEEPNAPKNSTRLKMLKNASLLSETKPFVSIEPIINFQSSLDMIHDAVEAFNSEIEFRIGLMSGVKRETYYTSSECDYFVKRVLNMQRLYNFDVIWKHSISNYYRKMFPGNELI